MNLTDRLAKINANRKTLRQRIDRKRARHEAWSADQIKFEQETTRQIKLETKLVKQRVA